MPSTIDAIGRRTPGRVSFNRPPRLRATLSRRGLEIPALPGLPVKPTSSVASSLVLPLVAVLAMSGMFLVSGVSMAESERFWLLVAAGGLVLGSTLPPAWMFIDERRRFRRHSRELVEAYGRRLRNVEAELAALRDEEQLLRVDQDPEPDRLLERARARSNRLWERRPEDDDFLSLRLGTGLSPTMLDVRFSPRASGDGDSPRLEALMAEAAAVSEQYQSVPDVPIRADLAQVGGVCLVGPYPSVAPLARAVLTQAAVHHSPDELMIAAFVSGLRLPDWLWLKWLPHVRAGRQGGGSPLLAWDVASREGLTRWLLAEITARRQVVADASSLLRPGDGSPTFPWLLVFIDDVRLAHLEPTLRDLQQEGPRLRLALVGLADDLASVPGGFGSVAAFEDRRDGLLAYMKADAAEDPTQCRPDALQGTQVEAIARALGGVHMLPDGATAEGGDLPSSVSYLEALDIPNVDGLERERPDALGDRTTLLRLPLGPGPDGGLVWLDLKEQAYGGHGPHGLVAGTTGAGKSELLLTLIAGLATRHPPDVVNFVLIDYKGGDAFKGVAELPHTVALITDLDNRLAARALTTLRGELKRRERRILELKSAGIAASPIEYQPRRAVAGPMPLLVIIVDEFARLKDELPEFISGLVDVARVGRSLGMHLILATQTPSGTVDDQIQKNANFGICLRVRDPADSRHVIGAPDAALLPGSLPGRGYFRAGLDPLRLFQTARVGAPYHPRDIQAPLIVQPFEPRLVPSPPALSEGEHTSLASSTNGHVTAPPISEMHALVGLLQHTAETTGVRALRWPEPLREQVQLCEPPDARFVYPAQPPHGDWLVAPVGVVDEPDEQSQAQFLLDVSRNCVVYGAAGSGKSTLLRTLATSLGLSHSPRSLHVYCLDFGSRSLAPLTALPHCGPSGVFYPRDTMRIRRLFRTLEHELTRRREAGITNLRQQRRSTDDAPDEPFLLVLIDNYASLRETFEEEEQQTRSMESLMADLVSLMRDGPAVGIQFVVTGTNSSSIHHGVANAAESRVTLRQNDRTEYSVVGRLEEVPERMPPGRGFAPGNPPREFQVALPPADEAVFPPLQSAAAGFQPPAVEDLPTWLSLEVEPTRSASPLSLQLGVSGEEFGRISVDLAEVSHLIVAGPAGSGKTSFLASCLLQLTAAVPGVRWFGAVPRPSPLAELASADMGCARLARNVPQLTELLDELEQAVDSRREAFRHEHEATASGSDAPLLLVIDDYELLRQDDEFYDVESRLARLARRGTPVGLHVVLAGSNVEIRDGRDELLRYLSQFRAGMLLQPDVELDGDLLAVRLRRQVGSPPPGRGAFVVRQRQHLVQLATPQLPHLSLTESLRARAQPSPPPSPRGRGNPLTGPRA